uniref:Uncharacterized protein n=1 Tax=Arundo donax TaxID=35708 RepID=A0A0A9CMI5_ARUDO
MNTSLKVSLLLRIAGHAISTSAPDRTSISNSFLSSCTGTPHSWSWKAA